MDQTSFEQSLRFFARKQPFRSFVVRLVDGESVTVDHPEALVIRGGIGVFVAADGQPTLFDHEGVASMKYAPARRAKAG